MNSETTCSNSANAPGPAGWRRIGVLAFAAAVVFALPATGLLLKPARAQSAASVEDAAAAEADRALRAAEEAALAETATKDAAAGDGPALSMFSILWPKDWWLVVPIYAMSLLVVTVGIERLLALRRGRVMPELLVDGIGRMSRQQGGFDPREAYKVCQRFPSAVASVIQVMLLKVGRPHEEVERAVNESKDREAGRLYSNVRWLNLAAAVTPLMGLLGTVWGMIMAFFATANLQSNQNRADVLAEGIYTALGTTFLGLVVAIPAAVLAHLLEGRIQRLFHEIDEMLFHLLPQIERFEGKLRVSRSELGEAPPPGQPHASPPASAPPYRQPGLANAEVVGAAAPSRE